MCANCPRADAQNTDVWYSTSRIDLTDCIGANPTPPMTASCHLCVPHPRGPIDSRSLRTPGAKIFAQSQAYKLAPAVAAAGRTVRTRPSCVRALPRAPCLGLAHMQLSLGEGLGACERHPVGAAHG